MINTIPASAIVSVAPSVLAAGGTAQDLSGLFLTNGIRVPIGSVMSFASQKDVSDYFGASSTEANAAAIYFNGFSSSNVKPKALLFAQYPTAAVPAYLRSASLAGMTLTELKALSGTLTIDANGTPLTSAAISLTGATSFSDAATIIQAGFTLPAFAVTYDATASAFVFTTTLTGATATMDYATGTLKDSLKLTLADGAVTSQGADIAVAATLMDSIVAQTTNFATFMTLFDPDASGNTNKQALAAWNATQNNQYVYTAWDTDITPTQSTAATTSLGYILKANNTSGTRCIYSADYTLAAFSCGVAASIDFTERQGRITFAYKAQSGLSASVTSQTAAANLVANGYDYYGAWATANDNFIGFGTGSISGDYAWADAYVNQIWMSNQFQLALMTLLFTVKSIPYNAAGNGLIEASLADPILQAVNFGAIQPGVLLSNAQAAEVNAAAGLKIDNTLSTRGWYLQVLPASAQVRAARSSPPCTFWYTDGGSVQTINLASITIQ